MTNKSKETKVRVMDDASAPHFSKVSKVYVTNQSGGGGGGNAGGTVDWNDITNKPTTFPNDEHNHDDRYNTKEDVQGLIDFTRGQMEAEQGKIMSHANDNLAYLENKVDNVTAVVEGNELKVKSIDGLTIGVANLNAWLSGTDSNIQSQIDDISGSLVAMTSGMEYIGKLETYADLQAVTNKENGDLAVVLADESHGGGRSMYVYRDDLGVWEFIGEFTFSDEFTALNDTPTSYAGAEGKVVKVSGERLVFDDVNYGDLTNKPESTITDIDSSVGKAHEHTNKSDLDKLGVNSAGELTINGVVYAPKNEPTEKKFLSAYLKNTQTIAREDFIKFDTIKGGSTIPYDINTGIFTLEVGKTYRVTVSVLGEIREWITIQYANEQKTNLAHPYSAVYGADSNMSDRGSSGVLDTTFTVSNQTNVGILVSETHESDNPVRLFNNRTMLVVQEL